MDAAMVVFVLVGVDIGVTGTVSGLCVTVLLAAFGLKVLQTHVGYYHLSEEPLISFPSLCSH